MTYNGTLEEVTSIENLDHAEARQEIAIIENNDVWWAEESENTVRSEEVV